MNEEVIIQALHDANQRQMKNRDDLFFRCCIGNGSGCDAEFRTKSSYDVEDPETQLFIAVPTYWDESAPGANKWKSIPNLKKSDHTNVLQGSE